jgi:L-fuconate dehydratase
VVVRDGRYVTPTTPGFSSAMRPETLTTFAYHSSDR